MKPVNIKQKRQKEIRVLLKRRQQLWTLHYALGYIKLEQPIRDGWYKEIVITHRIEIYKNQEAILEVHKIIVTYVWGKTKEKAALQWQKQTSDYLIYRDIPTISKKQYNRLSEAAQPLCVPFQYYTEKRKLRTRFYLKIPKGAYKIKFSRAYITHRKRIDPTINSELDFIDNQIKRKGYYNIAEAFYPWKDYWNLSDFKKEKLKEKRRLNDLKKLSIEHIIEDHFE